MKANQVRLAGRMCGRSVLLQQGVPTTPCKSPVLLEITLEVVHCKLHRLLMLP